MRGRAHTLVRVALAAFALCFAPPASAGPVQDAAAAYGRGDYMAMLAKIRETKSADWVALQAFVTQLGDSFYAEIAYRHLTAIRPDPAQPVRAAPPLTTSFGATLDAPARETFIAKADTACSIAFSLHVDRNDLRLWSLPDGAPVTKVTRPAKVWSIAISQHYLAIESDETANVYDVRTGAFVRAVAKIAVGKIQTAGLYFAPDGRQLAIVTELGPIFRAPETRLFDLASGIELPAQSIVLPSWSQSGVKASDCPVPKQQIFSQ